MIDIGNIVKVRWLRYNGEGTIVNGCKIAEIQWWRYDGGFTMVDTYDGDTMVEI